MPLSPFNGSHQLFSRRTKFWILYVHIVSSVSLTYYMHNGNHGENCRFRKANWGVTHDRQKQGNLFSFKLDGLKIQKPVKHILLVAAEARPVSHRKVKQ